MGVPSDKIEVVYNSSKSGSIGKRCERGKNILTVGHVVHYKNPECWLNVAKEVISRRPDVKFIWLGNGDMSESIREKIEELHLEDNVLMNGYCDNVNRYYSEALVYFQPSILESQGIAVIEAMSHALPCVTSNVGGLPETVADKETGFTCSPEDVDGFVKRILDLISDDTLREKMGIAGRSRVEKFFSEEFQEKKIMSLYKKLAGHVERV